MNEEIFDKISIKGLDTLGEVLEKENPDVAAVFGAIFALSDDDFEILRPLFQDLIVESYQKPESQMQVLQLMAQSGLTINDMIDNIDGIIDYLNQEKLELSESKKDFIRYIFTSLNNILESSTINPAHTIRIPVVICRDGAKLPEYATDGSAAMDIYSPDEYNIKPGETIIIPIGIRVAIPHGYALLIQPRSGLSARSKLRIANTPGLIDEDYHQEIGVIVENTDENLKDLRGVYKGEFIKDCGSTITIGKGERFAQMRLIEVPKVAWSQVNSLGEQEEDHGAGFGSTGK